MVFPKRPLFYNGIYFITNSRGRTYFNGLCLTYRVNINLVVGDGISEGSTLFNVVVDGQSLGVLIGWLIVQDGPPTSYKYGEITPGKPNYKAIYKGYNSIYNY